MLNLDDIAIKNDDKTWPYRIIEFPSGNYLLNKIQADSNIIAKIYFNDPNAFIEYFDIMDDIYDDVMIIIKKEKEKY